MTGRLEPASITDEQRATLILLVKDEPYRALVKAARTAGIPGTQRQIKDLLAADEAFQDALHDARGAVIDEVPALRTRRLFEKLGSLVENDGSSSQFRAVTFGLGLRGIGVTERTEVDVNHSGSVDNPDVAASIDRFNALTAAAIRAAGRNRPDGTPQLPE